MGRVLAFSKQAPSLVTFDEARWYPDPFGAGAGLLIARTDSPAHERWVEQEGERNPLLRRISFLAATLPAEEAERLDFRALRARAFQELVKEGSSPQSLASFNDLEKALDLLRGWRGVRDADTGEEVPYSAEAARDLLTVASTVVRDGAYRGMDLGVALVVFVITTAFAHTQERAALLGDLEKNSPPSSEPGVS